MHYMRLLGVLMLLSLIPRGGSAQGPAARVALASVAGSAVGGSVGMEVGKQLAEDAIAISTLAIVGSVFGLEVVLQSVGESGSSRSAIAGHAIGASIGLLAAYLGEQSLEQGFDDYRVWLIYSVPHGLMSASVRRAHERE